MSTQPQNHDRQTIKDTIRTEYAAIATKRKSSCGRSGCCYQADPTLLATAVGYEAASLEMVPDGANMGLSCGNPIAIVALREGQIVLDLGSGGGFDVFQAGVIVKAAGRVIGVDMTPEMLQKARKNIEPYRERAGLDNVEFRLGEIEHLPVADNSIDVVLSNCVINLSPEKAQVWREIYRVLKPGGKVSVSDLALSKPLPDHVHSMVGSLIGCVAGAVPADETKAMMESAGFHNIQLTPKPEYVRQMQEWNDPLYKEIAKLLPEGECIAEYIVSMSFTAQK
jgi:SAM-dependent methyltransferase